MIGPEYFQVVGVVADERLSPLEAKFDTPAMYVTNEQSPVFFG
jgi:hypothetical protein